MKTNQPARWFRMYAEFATDPKVQMLSEQDQRRYIMLLCLRCGNGDVTLHETEVAFQLRITEQEWLATKAVLLAKGLVTEDGKPTAWDKRQYASDSSAERVARHREKQKQGCNVTETKSNAVEEETETEKPIDANASVANVDESTSPDPLACPAEKIVELYHQHMPNNPRLRILNDKRRASIRQRWREAARMDAAPFGFTTQADGLNAWAEFFKVCADSDFLTGRVPPSAGRMPFVADLDFLMSPSGFVKCLENKYHRELA